MQAPRLVTRFHRCYPNKQGGNACQGAVPNPTVFYFPGAILVEGSRLLSPAPGLAIPGGGGRGTARLFPPVRGAAEPAAAAATVAERLGPVPAAGRFPGQPQPAPAATDAEHVRAAPAGCLSGKAFPGWIPRQQQLTAGCAAGMTDRWLQPTGPFTQPLISCSSLRPLPCSRASDAFQASALCHRPSACDRMSDSEGRMLGEQQAWQAGQRVWPRTIKRTGKRELPALILRGSVHYTQRIPRLRPLSEK